MTGLTVTENLCHTCPRIYSFCCNHNPILYSFITSHRVCNKTNIRVPLVLLVEETGVPEENLWPAVRHWQTLSHNGASSAPRLSGFELKTLLVICTDCIGRSKSNYHTITTTAVPSVHGTITEASLYMNDMWFVFLFSFLVHEYSLNTARSSLRNPCII